MKRTLNALLLALALAGCGREQVTAPTNAPTDVLDGADASDPVESTLKLKRDPTGPIAAAREKARQLMEAASRRTADPAAAGLFQKMNSALKTAKIQAPKAGHDLKACVSDPAVLAFVMLRHPHTIHVCARAASADPHELAQVLTHETAHVVGVHNECGATQVEVAIMRLSGANLAFRNGYMERCGIR